MRGHRLLALAAALVLVAALAPVHAQGRTDRVTLQLKWVAQAQFAGYYAAQAQGFYKAEGIDITIRPGGPDITPEQVVASGAAQFGIDWLPSLLSQREQGTPLVNVAQVFQYSGMREIAFKSSGIRTPADFKGRRIAVWFGGNEFELLATLAKYRLDKDKDVTLVQQPFDMNLLLKKQVDAAAAMTYNEYWQVIDAGVRPEDLVVIDFNKEGTAMLQDGIFAREDWLRTNRALAARFLKASLRGWTYCRDSPASCVDTVMKQDATGVMSRKHQTRMMSEVNKLIWGPPAPAVALGRMDPAAFKRTAAIALQFGVIKKPATASAYTHEIWQMATR